MIAQIKSICCPDNINTKSIHNKWPISRLLKKKTSGRNCAYRSFICYICDTYRWRRRINRDFWHNLLICLRKYIKFDIYQSVVIPILKLRRRNLMYNSSIIIATHMSYNYFPCVKGRSINNIRKYLPIFRATLITVCCLCSYICTVVLEAGNRVWIPLLVIKNVVESRQYHRTYIHTRVPSPNKPTMMSNLPVWYVSILPSTFCVILQNIFHEQDNSSDTDQQPPFGVRDLISVIWDATPNTCIMLIFICLLLKKW